MKVDFLLEWWYITFSMGNSIERKRGFFKNAVRGITDATIPLLFFACVEKQAAFTPIPLASTPTPIHEDIPEPYDQATKESLIEPKLKIRLENLKIPTLVENFTNSAINLKAIYYIYDGFDKSTPLVRFYHNLNNQERIFTLTQKSLNDRAMLFMPASGPVPQHFGDIQSKEESSGLLIDTNQRFAISYVQEKKGGEGIFSHPDNEFTANFVTQVCRQVVSVNVSKMNGEPVEDQAEKEIAERIVCNSIGRARAARMINVSYKEYRGFMEGFRIVGTEEPLVLDEASYNSFPTLGPIIKSHSIS